MVDPRPAHPKYGKPLSGAPVTVDGVTFRPYRSGVLRYVRVSDDFRAEVFGGYGAMKSVQVDGTFLPKRFRTDRAAYAAAAKALAEKPA